MRLFGRIVIIFACFAIFAIPFGQVGNPSGPAWTAWTQKPELTHDIDFAVIGDSRSHSDISPRILSEVWAPQGALKGYNFSVDGTDVLHHISFASHALLESDHKPKFIIWTPHPLQFDGNRSNNRLEELVSPNVTPLADIGTYIKAGAPIEFLLDVITKSLFSPWEHRSMMAEKISEHMVAAGLRTLPYQQRFLGLTVVPEVEGRTYLFEADGQSPFIVLSHGQERFDRGVTVYRYDYENLKLSEWHFELAKMLAQKAAAAHVTLIILELPVAPWFQENLLENRKHLAWRARMKEIAASEGAIYIDHSRFYSERENFGDPGHLVKSAADDYSKSLAQVLAEDPKIQKLMQSTAKDSK